MCNTLYTISNYLDEDLSVDTILALYRVRQIAIDLASGTIHCARTGHVLVFEL